MNSTAVSAASVQQSKRRGVSHRLVEVDDDCPQSRGCLKTKDNELLNYCILRASAVTDK